MDTMHTASAGNGPIGRTSTRRGLTLSQRTLGQRAALRANLLTMIANSIVIGPLMMLFANDALHFSPKRISAILAIIPAVGLARIFLLEPLRRLGKRRVILIGDTVRLAAIALLLAFPVQQLNFTFFTLLLCLFVAGQQFGIGIAWQPLLRDITTDSDRGRFFASMRFRFQAVTATAMVILPFFLGDRIEPWQYKLLLTLAAAGTLNRMIWISKIPECPPVDDGEAHALFSPRLWRTLKQSRLLRTPLLISALLLLTQAPIYIIYLRTMMHAPAHIVSIRLAANTLGVVASMLLWGRMADALGYRPMLVGLIMLKLALLPLHLLVAPFPVPFPGWMQADLASLVTIAILTLNGFLHGALIAGVGLAETAVQHHHVRSQDSFEALNLFQMALVPITAGVQIFFGFWLSDIAMPQGHTIFANGIFYFDWLKGYLFFAAAPIMVLVLLLLRRLPNTRPWFSVGHFFTALSMAPLRLMMAERRVFHEDEDTRCRTARWFAAHPSPLAVGPLCELLSDPSYDVRIAAIRALAETDSALAGSRLLEMLQDKNARFVAAPTAWALGELRYQPAFDALCAALKDDTQAELQSMAARALGKIGDERAASVLAEHLKQAPVRRKVISSTARALLRFENAARSEATLLFDALVRLEEREDRFELMDGLCGLLEIPNTWLLRHLESGSGARGALILYTDLQSTPWRKACAPLIEALNKNRFDTIRRQAVAEADPHDPVHSGLCAALAKDPPSLSCHVLAAAWLLLRKTRKPGERS